VGQSDAILTPENWLRRDDVAGAQRSIGATRGSCTRLAVSSDFERRVCLQGISLANKGGDGSVSTRLLRTAYFIDLDRVGEKELLSSFFRYEYGASELTPNI
jgi:hypothetical protein